MFRKQIAQLQTNTCNRCCWCSHLKHLLCVMEDVLKALEVKSQCLFPALFLGASGALPERKRKLCLMVSLAQDLSADTLSRESVMLILMVALFSVLWRLYCPGLCY